MIKVMQKLMFTYFTNFYTFLLFYTFILIFIKVCLSNTILCCKTPVLLLDVSSLSLKFMPKDFYFHFVLLKRQLRALTGVSQWVGHRPVD